MRTLILLVIILNASLAQGAMTVPAVRHFLHKDSFWSILKKPDTVSLETTVGHDRNSKFDVFVKPFCRKLSIDANGVETIVGDIPVVPENFHLYPGQIRKVKIVFPNKEGSTLAMFGAQITRNNPAIKQDGLGKIQVLLSQQYYFMLSIGAFKVDPFLEVEKGGNGNLRVIITNRSIFGFEAHLYGVRKDEKVKKWPHFWQQGNKRRVFHLEDVNNLDGIVLSVGHADRDYGIKLE